MALRREQHQETLAGDLVLMVAEQALGGFVQRQDAAGRIERDGAVARPIEHRLKVAARQTAARRRPASRERRSAISVAGAPSQAITCAWPSTDKICPSALTIATAPASSAVIACGSRSRNMPESAFAA